MTAKPVAAGRTGPAIPMENDAGAAAATASAAAARKGAAGKKEAGKARASGSAPATGAAGSSGKLGTSVDKALGKVKRQAPSAAKPAGGAQGRTTTGASGSSGYSTTAAAAASGEWGFLQDKNLSIDEKLFRYMMLLQKKADAELEKFMEATGPEAKATSSSSKGTSLFDVLKTVVPALGVAEGLIGEAGLKKLAGQLAGPVLAAAATAAGLPALAPAALQVGSSLAQMAFQDVGSRSAAGTSTAAAGNEYSKMTDEQRSLWLQHLLEKQKAMFTAVSNTLRCMHDTQMAAIHNIR